MSAAARQHVQSLNLSEDRKILRRYRVKESSIVTLYLCTRLLQKAVGMGCNLREVAEMLVRDQHISRQHLPTDLETVVDNALGNHKMDPIDINSFVPSPPPPPEFYTRVEKELDAVVARKLANRKA